MTDFSKLFTDPSAEVYGADETENAMWQQSSTNPFAVLHAIAARRNANNRRDQYGQQLAAHDERAVSGTRGLMEQENKYNSIQEMIKQKMIDPGTISDLSQLRTPGNSGQFDALSDIFAANNKAAAFKDMGAGSQSFAAAGKDPMQEDSLSNLIGVGNLADVASTSERDQMAKDAANKGKSKFITQFESDAGADGTYRTEETLTPEEIAQRVTDYRTAGKIRPTGYVDPKTKTGGGKTNGGAATAPPATTKRNAPAQAPAQITPGKLTAAAVAERPPEQMNTLTKLKRSGIPTSNGTFMFVPNSLEIDEEGNVTTVFRLQANGKVVETIAQVAPDGQYRTN